MVSIRQTSLYPALGGLILTALVAGTSFADTSNTLTLELQGEENVLDIVQEHEPRSGTSQAQNVARIVLAGDRNGGYFPIWTRAAFATVPLAPGRIEQQGIGNRMQLAVVGDYNQLSVLQRGHANNVGGRIRGTENAVAVAQYGNGNSASFSQTGTGNAIMITQRAY